VVMSRMSRNLVMVLSITVIGSIAGGTSRAEIMYTINSPANPTVGGSIEGTITTDGHTGNLSVSDILSFNIDVLSTTGQALLTVTPTDFTSVVIEGVITVTKTEIEITEGAPFNAIGFFSTTLPGDPQFEYVAPPVPTISIGAFQSESPFKEYFSATELSQFTIATVSVTSVPEPSTLVLGAMGSAAFILYGCLRRRSHR
jgi:hypothetical protein